MLVVAMIWSTLPASACLAAPLSMGSRACCRGMAQNCPMRGMSASGLCCPAHRVNAVAPEVLSSPEHAQTAGFLPCHASLAAHAAPRVANQVALEAPPPGSSPGKNSVLRI